MPVGTTGVTIEVAGKAIRVPSIGGVSVCSAVPGLPGIPSVRNEPNGGVSVVITAGSGNPGAFMLNWSVDGSSSQLYVPVPGTGPGTETCLVGVGSPARADCLAKVSLDEPPEIPPIPPVPPVELPPIPPVEPPECVKPWQCDPRVEEIVEALPLVVERVEEIVQETLRRPKCRSTGARFSETANPVRNGEARLRPGLLSRKEAKPLRRMLTGRPGG